MRVGRNIKQFLCATAAIVGAGSAQAQDAAPATAELGVGDIVVTAQKRSESANRVGMSITALPGEALVQLGITTPNDLVKIVPGFQATEAPRGTPIFAIRGIGFDDSTLGSASTVAIYVDEVPLSFSPEARFAALDLERVEVLKGPQGILFGQNSTAGAINFIAAKPTKEVSAGLDLTYGRFDTMEARGFMSAPLSDTLGVRISAMGVRSGGWQKSFTRDDSLGDKRQFAGRFLAQWNPIPDLRITLNLNGWSDRSDTQAAQLLESFPAIASTALPAYDAYPRAPRNARSADWDADPDSPFRRDDNFVQISLRGEYDVSDQVTLTSITAWSRYNQDFTQDVDGSALQNLSLTNEGKVRSFNQELRLSGDMGDIKWILGGNYARDKAFETSYYSFTQNSLNLGFLGIHDADAWIRQPIRNIAAFANVDYTFGQLTVHAGTRYTRDKRKFEGCTADPDTDGIERTAFNIILGLTGTPNEIGPGECITSLNGIPGVVRNSLDEDNVSWRLGLDYQVNRDTMLYANVSRGYKSGGFPAVNSAAALQLSGVTQESVLAYEAGLKASLLDRRVQFNAAGFYYDYQDKQLRGRILDPFGAFGVLDVLLNIPKSRVYGAEVSLQAAPAEGLNFSVAGTYVNTKVKQNPAEAYDPVGNILNYEGLSFPHTPKWNITASADYETPISTGMEAFVGANLAYQSKTEGLFHRPELIGATLASPTLRPGVFLDPDTFKVKAYTTVDARVGVQDAGGQWKAWIWGRNIFNTYYWNNVTQSLDSIYRLTSMPRTYGATVSLRF